jgi:hypothetical protein
MLDVRYDQYLTDEDSWVESIGAMAFLVASILFFITYWQSEDNGNDFYWFKTNKNWIFLGLSFLFFVAFGEEISWGQRIFGWSTPEELAKVNYQQETNIHNLDFFTFKHETNDEWYAPLLVLNAGRIFFYFWFSFMVIIPLLNQFHKKSRRLFSRINIPIAPLWTGILMISILIIAKVYKVLFAKSPGDYSGSIDEIMECNYALVIATLAYVLYRKSTAYISSRLSSQNSPAANA